MDTKKTKGGLIPFSDEYLPRVFTLQNNGVLCYLNSITQALMSCTSLNYCLQQCQKYNNASDNDLALAYIRLLLKHPPETEDLGKFQAIHTDDASEILMLINRARQGKKDNLLFGRQEDIHEGLVLFLDTIQNGVENLFYTRNQCEIYCRKCKDHRPSGEGKAEPPEIIVDLSEEDPLIQETLLSKEDIEKYISGSVQIPRDYKCENCGVSNDYNKETSTVTPNVMQIYTLVRLSEIIVLLFKKYTKKDERYFPPTLEFSSNAGILNYKVVAQIEHSGGMAGGHYICKCLRNKPLHMHEVRLQKAQALIQKNEKLLLTCKITDRENIEQELNNLRNSMIKDEVLRKEKYGVFALNDTRVTFCPEGFVPTNDTYMVFYHLFNPVNFITSLMDDVSV
jgi:ubiquitin C-terminal hydrolase